MADITTTRRSGRTSRRISFRNASRQVGVQAPLVKLVQHHGADALEERIVEDLTVEDSLGLDPEPGPTRDLPLDPDLVADLLAERPTLFEGDPRGGGPRRHPARLEHDHSGVVRGKQAGPDDRRRHPRGLARARRGDQDERPVGPQGLQDPGQAGVDRERMHGMSLASRCASRSGRAHRLCADKGTIRPLMNR